MSDATYVSDHASDPGPGARMSPCPDPQRSGRHGGLRMILIEMHGYLASDDDAGPPIVNLDAEYEKRQPIPPDDVWDEKWDAPLSQEQWNACKWMYEDRSTTGTAEARKAERA